MEFDINQAPWEDDDGKEIESKGFFSILGENPPIVQTKVGELAKYFLWDPFFPIHVNDSLLHVLLLLSKHRLQVLPVMEQSESKVIGIVSQNAVIRALLQASGLEWFHSIADRSLSEFRL
ncbi:hypothetical protein ACH5RR_002351 [Cinchona calisaya]|uniref:CBS domain-containing protein n=1 Tax=Cinchona calisaya TaxID=153742 RepID=A0ABD3B6L8_9GENT